MMDTLNTDLPSETARRSLHWALLRGCPWVLVAISLLGCQRDAEDPAETTRSSSVSSAARLPDEFFSLMNRGKNFLDQGDAAGALATYQEAATLVPQDADVHLNLANAHLLADSAIEAIREADLVLALEPHSAAAYFVRGSAFLRLMNPEEAVKALENSRQIDPAVTATLFQLGLARMGMNQWDEAIAAFQEGLRLEPNRLHTSAHYLLAQALIRAGRQAEAERELEQHQATLGDEGPTMGAAVFERSKHTRARIPFRLDQPDHDGVPVVFREATKAVFGDAAEAFSGPIGLIDVERSGGTGLFLTETGVGFRLLKNVDGTLIRHGQPLVSPSASVPSQILVGDLQNDRHEDILVLGRAGSQLFTMAEMGVLTDHTEASGLARLRAARGLLIDLDFTGKLDLAVVTADSHEVRILSQSDPLTFAPVSGGSEGPAALQGVSDLAMEDWNRDHVMDLVVGRQEGRPLLLEKQRGGELVPSEQDDWEEGTVYCTGDFNNDLRPDLAVRGKGRISLCFNGGERRDIAISDEVAISAIRPFDFDNDGWLDLWVVGEGIRVWRNLGLSGFQEHTDRLGLSALSLGPIAELHFADFDRDCDSDVVVALAAGGLRYLRNDGGNANSQVKVQMVGNRSNASGIGTKIEIETGGLRLIRTVQQLPVEIGVGEHE